MAISNTRPLVGIIKQLQQPILIKRFFNHRLSLEHKLIQSTCRNFAEKELKPVANHLDKTAVFPKQKIQQLGKMGYLAMGTHPDYDGMGLDSLAIAIAVEELSRGCASTGVIVSIHNCLFANLINKRGTTEQKLKYLKPFAKTTLGCFALSEPNAGTNVADLATTARQDGDYWIINGSKSWVSSAHEGEAIIVFANTDKSLNHKGITAFIVDRNTPGVILGLKENLMGIRALTSCNVTFEVVRVHKENVLGDIGEGFKIAMKQLDQARIGIAAQALGIAQAALECAVHYSLHKTAFEKPIAHLSSVQNRLSEMAISLDAARLLVWRAALEYDAGARSSKYTSMGKVSASRCANFVADNCIQIMGGMGLATEFPAERHYRDARVTKIYGGVTDIQKTVIAQELIKEYQKKS
ncbi:short-chain specific acyl-CoA dehydrogenase, mitochondrial-like [Arctopsyche grandis]|uniref:short-chain specific acyl-CoA dehydrogenase, mitochondrial-like n=1 Tax=Arctopsyche grandis TaxID=121162 RepID=UPI00406D6BA9